MSKLPEDHSALDTLGTERHVYRFKTYQKSNEYDCCWTIHSFGDWLADVEDQRMQHSPMFPADPSAPFRWVLGLNTKDEKDGAVYCSLIVSLRIASATVSIKTNHMSISLKSDSADVITWQTNTSPFLLEQGEAIVFPRIILRQTLLDKVQNGVLVVCCNARVTTGFVTETELARVDLSDRLSDEMTTLAESGEFGDTTVMVGERRFLVYRKILAARSSVFAAMLENDRNTTVTIADIEAEVFQELLGYIYSARINNLEAFSFKLFAVADKYRIAPLKTLCQQAILANLNVQSAAQTLLFADTHGATEMKDRVLQFLGSEASRGVTKTDGWISMARDHPRLVGEAFLARYSKVPNDGVVTLP